MAKLPKRLSLLLVSLVLCATTLVACSNNSEEETEKATVFNLKIVDGELNIESGLIRAKQGDGIILRVDAYEKGVLHLHGYEIFREVGPGESTDIELVADDIGRSSITFHPVGGDDVDGQKEINLGALEVRPR